MHTHKQTHTHTHAQREREMTEIIKEGGEDREFASSIIFYFKKLIKKSGPRMTTSILKQDPNA